MATQSGFVEAVGQAYCDFHTEQAKSWQPVVFNAAEWDHAKAFATVVSFLRSNVGNLDGNPATGAQWSIRSAMALMDADEFSMIKRRYPGDLPRIIAAYNETH